MNSSHWLARLAALVLVFSIAFGLAGAQTTAPSATSPSTEDPDFVTDNCTWFPDGNYADCCVQHDREYFAGGSWKARWRSDKKLFKCVAAKPKFYNKLVAPVMWLGVRAFGVSWLKTRASWGFGKRIKAAKNRKKQPGK